jgi:hypothetical protein
VVGVDGESLRLLRDCPEWIKQIKKSQKGRRRSVASKSKDDASGVETSDDDDGKSSQHKKARVSNSRGDDAGKSSKHKKAQVSNPRGNDVSVVITQKSKAHAPTEIMTISSDSDTGHVTKNKTSRAHHHKPSKKRPREETDTDVVSNRKGKHRVVVADNSDEDKRGMRKGSSRDKVDASRTSRAKDKGGHSARRRRSSSVSSSNHHNEPSAPFTQSTPSTSDTRPVKRHRHEEQHVVSRDKGKRKPEGKPKVTDAKNYHYRKPAAIKKNDTSESGSEDSGSEDSESSE